MVSILSYRPLSLMIISTREGPSRGLLRDCEIFANLRFQLYFVLGCEEPIQEQFVRSRGAGEEG